MSENEVKGLPKKRVYKRRSTVPDKEFVPVNSNGLPPEDLEAFRNLLPKLSPKGREIVSLLLKAFNEKGEVNPNQLLQTVNLYASQEKSNNLAPLLNMLPLLTSSLGNQQGINPAVLTSLLGMLMSNRPRD
jgi:hypothetical protein